MLTNLLELDQKLFCYFEQDDFDAEEILELVDKREQLLMRIYTEPLSKDIFVSTPEWHNAIKRTEKLVELMRQHTDKLGRQLKKFQHGNQSIQRYQQFL